MNRVDGGRSGYRLPVITGAEIVRGANGGRPTPSVR